MEQEETNITMSVFPFLIIYFYYLIYIVGDKTKIKIHCPWKYCEKNHMTNTQNAENEQ